MAEPDIKDLDLDYEWDVDAPRAISLAIETEAAALQFDDRISNSEGATVDTNCGTRTYGNSHGFIGSVSRTSHSITCVVLAEADGVMQRDYFYPALADRDAPVTWTEKGAPDIWTRARDRAREVLANHRPEYLSGQADAAIRGKFRILLP